eukprot:PhF_6_TR30832/c0_g1_i1/m.45382
MWKQAAYRTASKFVDLRHAIVTKQGFDFEHVGIDLANYIELSVSIHKEEWTDKRDIAKLTSKTAFYGLDAVKKQVLSHVEPHSSFALFLDGSLPLWTLRAMRKNKKVYKLQHCPCTELMVRTEEVVCDWAINRLKDSQGKFVNEIVFSGTRSPGFIESKMSGWVQDLAA